MISYGRHLISKADIDAVVDVLRSDWLTQGPLVSRFEQCVADKVRASYAVAVNSSTSALHIACLALGVGPGDWVWTSPNTFVASANCALFCGANIDFVDIDPITYNISLARLEEKLEEASKLGKLPKVVIPVHFAGQPCDMEGICRLSSKFGFRVIEDASHALGASYTVSSKGSPSSADCEDVLIGACRHSDVTVFSFHPVKIITTGEGGMALTNSHEVHRKMLRLRSHGITNEPREMHPRNPEEIWNYQQLELGFNYRLTDIQAALGVSQLEQLDDFIGRRREIAAFYDHALANLPLNLPSRPQFSYSSYHLYPVRLSSGAARKSGQRPTYNKLRSLGIGVNLHYIPVHRHPFYEALGFKSRQFPEAESFHREALSLPIHPGLSEADLAEVTYALELALSDVN